MTGISRGRQYEDGPLEPIGWNVYGSTAPGAEPSGFIDRDGHFLRNLLEPETPPGPPFTHTFAFPEEPDRPPRDYGLRSWWAARCRWHLGPHRPLRIEWSSPPPSHTLIWWGGGQHHGESYRQCANCGKQL